MAESFITLHEAADLIAPRFGGRRPSYPTVHAWTRRGVRGVVLETRRMGGSIFTTRAAVDQFLAAIERRVPASI